MHVTKYNELASALRHRPSGWVNALILALDVMALWTALRFLAKPAAATEGLPGFLIGASPLLYLAAQAVVALVAFHGFALMHEAVHGSGARSKIGNALLGYVASILCALPFEPWRQLHLQHHRWAGNVAKDPALGAVRGYNPRKRAKNALLSFAWGSWVPLLAGVQQLVFWAYPLRFLKGRHSKVEIAKVIVSCSLPPLTFGTLMLVAPSLVAKLWPAAVLYLAMTELINFPHHIGTSTLAEDQRLSVKDQYRVTRSSYFPPLVAELLMLNFNFHTEHHLFPGLPWWALRRARTQLRQVIGRQYQGCTGIGWNLENRRRPAAEVFLRSRVAESGSSSRTGRQSSGRPLRRAGKQILFRALGLAPARWRYPVYRRLVAVEPTPPANLIFKLAETEGELEAAFRILHDAYVESGFMAKDPSGLRFTKYHALPTTSTLIAVLDGEVVGTVSVVLDGAFGLPMQSIFDLTALRRDGKLAEISALAIKRDRRGMHGQILFPLTKFMYEYAIRYLNVDTWVAAVNPRHVDFYKAILMFEDIATERVGNYAFVNDNPACGIYLDLKKAPVMFHAAFGARVARRDLHSYYCMPAFPNFHFPKRDEFKAWDPVLTKQLATYFFGERSGVLATLSDKELFFLREIYLGSEIASLIPRPLRGPRTHRRAEPRFPVACRAMLGAESGTLGDLQVQDVSARGLRVRGAGAIEQGRRYLLKVEVGPERCASLVVTSIRDEGGGRHALRICESSREWLRYIRALERDLFKAEPRVEVSFEVAAASA